MSDKVCEQCQKCIAAHEALARNVNGLMDENAGLRRELDAAYELLRVAHEERRRTER